MQPTYLIASSSGPTPWKAVNHLLTPFNMAFSAISSSTATYQIECTLDNPVPFSPAAANAVGVMINNPSSQSPLAYALTSAIVAANTSAPYTITFPIAAWRVNITSSYCGSPVIATAIQAGQKHDKI